MGLDTVELVMAIEEDFGIEIPDAVAEKIISVRHMRDFLVAELHRLGRPTEPDAVFARLREITIEHAGVNPSAVVLDAGFVRDLRME